MHEDIKELKADVKILVQQSAEIRRDVGKIQVDVAHHIRRTDLNEMRIEKMEKWLLGILTSILIAVVLSKIFLS